MWMFQLSAVTSSPGGLAEDEDVAFARRDVERAGALECVARALHVEAERQRRERRQAPAIGGAQAVLPGGRVGRRRHRAELGDELLRVVAEGRRDDDAGAVGQQARVADEDRA